MSTAKIIPTGVISVRLELCAKCAAPCEGYLHARIEHTDPCARCSAAPPRWGEYGRCTQFGLGDAVAVIAQPIARTIDRALGTRISECGGCKQRRAALNRIVPNI